MTDININIDLSQLEKWYQILVERVSHLSGGDILFIILALIMPPLPVFLKVGLTSHFWINLVLTVLGVVPGQIHALWVVLFM